MTEDERRMALFEMMSRRQGAMPPQPMQGMQPMPHMQGMPGMQPPMPAVPQAQQMPGQQRPMAPMDVMAVLAQSMPGQQGMMPGAMPMPGMPMPTMEMPSGLMSEAPHQRRAKPKRHTDLMMRSEGSKGSTPEGTVPKVGASSPEGDVPWPRDR